MITDDGDFAFDPNQLLLPMSGRTTCPIRRAAELHARIVEAKGRWAPARTPVPEELSWTHEPDEDSE